MGLFRRKPKTERVPFFLLFQRILYQRLGLLEMPGEPYYTMVWVGLTVLGAYLAFAIFERFSWGRLSGLALVLAGIAVLVFAALRFGVRSVPASATSLAVSLRLRLGDRERALLLARGIDPAHPGDIGRFVESLWERECDSEPAATAE